MSELPQGWTSGALSELGTWLGGGTPSKAVRTYWEGGTVHWVSPKDMKRLRIDSAQDQITEEAVARSATNLVPANSVLMVTRSGILEHSFPVAINTVPVAINQDLKAWTPRDGLDAAYAAYFLRSRAQDILASCSKDGTTVSSIDFDRLASYRMVVAPKPEQRHIASKIDELFSRIEEGERALERVRTLVERYRQSMLEAAVTGELTREWREQRQGQLEPGEALLQRILKARREAWQRASPSRKYLEHARLDARDLPLLPPEWTWVTLPMLCAPGTANGISVKGSNVPPGVPALRLDAMQAGGFDYSAKRYIPISEEDAERLCVQEGDFFVSRANGSLSLVGRATLAQAAPERIVYPDTMIRYRMIDWPGLREWIAVAWTSGFVRAQIERRAKTTAGIYKISQEDIAQIAIPLPSIGELAASVSLVEERLSQAIASNELMAALCQSSALRQGVLKRAFDGQLVPQHA